MCPFSTPHPTRLQLFAKLDYCQNDKNGFSFQWRSTSPATGFTPTPLSYRSRSLFLISDQFHCCHMIQLYYIVQNMTHFYHHRVQRATSQLIQKETCWCGSITLRGATIIIVIFPIWITFFFLTGQSFSLWLQAMSCFTPGRGKVQKPNFVGESLTITNSVFKCFILFHSSLYLGHFFPEHPLLYLYLG